MLKEISIVSLFPEIINAYLKESIIKKSLTRELIKIENINLRDYSPDKKHHKVDDVPFGGSTGMVIQYEPVEKAFSSLFNDSHYKIMLSPVGKTLDNKLLHNLLNKEKIVLLAGHYEGFDKRIDSLVNEKISVGNFVLTGGELPALIIADSLIRLIPGVLGNSDSFMSDSFYNGLLDWDVFTRPQNFDKLCVPDVLISGNHKKIERWKKRSAIINTLMYKPELIAGYKFNKEDSEILLEYLLEEDEDELTN